MPTVGMPLPCCARATNGAAMEAPTTVMNSRRFMDILTRPSPSGALARRLSGARKRPNVDGGGTVTELLDRLVVWRIPEGTDCLHVGKFEHDHWPCIVIAFEDFDL